MTRNNESSDWPDTDTLCMLVREGLEHRRAWALIIGLSKQYLAERKRAPDEVYVQSEKHAEHVVRIRDLEAKVISQKAVLRELNECRTFEAVTEQLLVVSLENIAASTRDPLILNIVDRALTVNAERKGPRPAVDEEQVPE